MRIVVSNLSSKTTKTQLADLFGQHGNVTRVRLAAVVTMQDSGQATKAVKALSGHKLRGRVLKVRPARSSN